MKEGEGWRGKCLLIYLGLFVCLFCLYVCLYVCNVCTVLVWWWCVYGEIAVERIGASDLAFDRFLSLSYAACLPACLRTRCLFRVVSFVFFLT